MSVTCAGIIMPIRISMNSGSRPRKGMRANTKPDMELMTRLMTTVITVTIRLFWK